MKTNKAKKEFWDFVIESCSKFIWHNAISPNHPQGFAPRSSLFRWQECLISVFHHYCYLYFGRIITEKICIFFFFPCSSTASSCGDRPGTPHPPALPPSGCKLGVAVFQPVAGLGCLSEKSKDSSCELTIQGGQPRPGVYGSALPGS